MTSWAANESPTNDQRPDRRTGRSGRLPGTCWSGWPDLNRRPLRPEQRPPKLTTRTFRHRPRTEAPLKVRWEPLRDVPEQDRLPIVSHPVIDGSDSFVIHRRKAASDRDAAVQAQLHDGRSGEDSVSPPTNAERNSLREGGGGSR